MKTISILLLLIGLLFPAHAQLNPNRVKKWYFGSSTGLDFTSSPPSTITANLSTTEGSSCISDNQANTVFYASGWQVKNKNNLFMANGTGLLGHTSSSQAALIVPWPGSDSVYYLFTTDALGGPNGFMYSLVDMSLAAGLGSVTAKNLAIQAPSCEKLVATMHCNGHDVWVLTHDYGSNDFRALLVTNTGITSTVISSVGPVISSSTTTQGQMKFSPTGKKLLTATIGLGFDLYDFDNSSGLVSNFMSIGTNTLASGVEFSPDSRFLYGSTSGPVKSITQWDLCAGSATAISASAYPLGPFINGNGLSPLQLGPDGRIYNSASATYSMNVISNPNGAGASCGYQDGGLYVYPGSPNFSIPNFVSNYFRQQASAFTYTANCQQVAFTGMSTAAYAAATCTATGSPLLFTNWDFGDPASGLTNTINAINPSHYYSGAGTFTAQLVMGYSCRNDTLRQVITIPALSPAITFSTHPAICKGETATLTLNSSGPVTWLPAGTGSGTLVTVNPTATTIYTVTASDANNCTTTKTLSLVVNKCLSVDETIAGGNVRVYPNPGNGELFIESQMRVKVIVSDYLGRKMISEELPEGTTSLDITMLSPGEYIIEVTDGVHKKRNFDYIKVE